MLSVVYAECCKEAYYAEYHNAECCKEASYAEYHNAECRYAKCRFAEFRGTV